MKEPTSRVELLRGVGPAAFALILLLAAPLWERWLPATEPTARWPYLILCLVTISASLHGSRRRWTLNLATITLPVTIGFFGTAMAAWMVMVAFVAREGLLRLLPSKPARSVSSLPILDLLARGGHLVLAVLAGGWVWQGGRANDHLGWQLLAVLAYLLVVTALHSLDFQWSGRPKSVEWRDLAGSSSLDAIGWLVGLAFVPIVLGLNWSVALVPLVALGLLAADAARNLHLRRRAVDQVSELWEVTRAGHRIIFRSPDLAGMVGQVLEECRNMIPFSWFQFELLKGDGGPRSWFAGPDGRIEEGIPEPADSPPALPGIHRRSSWKVLGRELKGDGEAIARVRFWCDPRRLEPTSVELLDSLLPQVASSVHRALLDRRAKHDPLTGLADRGVLEKHLESVFSAIRDEGGSMAVIMCDLDRFKKVNDTYGHDVGDRALLRIAEVLEKHRRETDICCRYGGEEFAVVLDQTNGETAQRVAERLRLEVQRTVFTAKDERVYLRLSAGVAAYPELFVKDGKELLVLADEALRIAKRQGRNRSLLHLGRGKYRKSDGTEVDVDESPPEPEAPTLFA
jgi:diguanylate cyclase (GGDEF)-like protein